LIDYDELLISFLVVDELQIRTYLDINSTAT